MAVPLSAVGLSKCFGRVVAADDVSFDLIAGTITGLVGPNGAGKTTVLNLIAGFEEPDAGTVLMGDSDIQELPPSRRVQQGMARTFQLVQLCSDLTVADNIMIGLHKRARGNLLGAIGRTGRFLDEEHMIAGETLHIAERLGLQDHLEMLVSELPFGTRRTVELARALATDPHVILLDEPAAGLNVAAVEVLAQTLVDLRADGLAILVVEHNVPFVRRVSDHVVVLDAGTVIAQGASGEVFSNDRVIRAYLGSEEHQGEVSEL